MSENEKESGIPPRKSERVKKPSESDSACKKYPELYDDDEVVKRQMEMISESLAACKRISKRRSPKKVSDLFYKSERVLHETPNENAPKERMETSQHDSSPVLSYIMREKTNRNDEEERQTSETLSESLPDLEMFSSLPDISGTLPERKETSKIEIYKLEEIDPIKMVEVIQRELKTLLEMAPTVAPTVNELFDTFHHSQNCLKCNGKIHSSLPLILKTVQELIKHVTKKRRGTYVWPNECSYLRLSTVQSIKEKKSSEENKEKVGKENKREIVLGRLEKVDAFGHFKPGVQIQFEEVQTEKLKKRLFQRTEKIQIIKPGDLSLKRRYPTERPKELSSNFVYRLEKPSLPRKITWSVKRSVLKPRDFRLAVRFLPQYRTLQTFSGFVLVPVDQVTTYRSDSNEANRKGLNVVEILPTRVDRMQVQKMKELEAEVKGLKDLMLEVHKNQMELSKVLTEKGVCSQPILKLTDPKMLDEENEVVRKATQMGINQPETLSMDRLQRTVDDLKRKCAIKNRMMVTLLKGLRSDVPNEWWEEIIDHVFADSKATGEIDPGRMNEFVRQTTAYLVSKNKTARGPSTTQNDDKLSEESLENRGLSPRNSSIDDLEYSDAVSGLERDNSSTESDYKTVNEELGEDQSEMVKTTPNSLAAIWEASSFVQDLLFEDSQAGVAIVDLFVAAKSAKESIDTITHLNDTVHKKLINLGHETGVIRTEYENLVRTMAAFFEKVKVESRLLSLESEPVKKPTANRIQKPEAKRSKSRSPEIGRFCSSCGFVKHFRGNVVCPLCKGEIIVRETCSDCAAVKQLERREETKCESFSVSICQSCGLPELKENKSKPENSITEPKTSEKMESWKTDEQTESMRSTKETGKNENSSMNLDKSSEEERTSLKEDLKGNENSLEQTPGASIPSKVVESLFEFLMNHVLQLKEGVKSTTTRESLFSSSIISESGIVVSHEGSQKSEGSMSLSDSAVQMISEVCGILGMIGPQRRPPEDTSTTSYKTPNFEEVEGVSKGKNPTTNPRNHQTHRLPTISDTRTTGDCQNSIITIYLPESMNLVPENKKSGQSSEPQLEERRMQSEKTPLLKSDESMPPIPEDNSDCEVFEEALSEPYIPYPSLSPSRGVNCMGDLTKEVLRTKKSVSTLTATNEFVSSWIGKITEDIKTKIRSLKSDRGRKQVAVTDEKNSGKGSKRLSKALEFTITAHTQVGVFDVTVRQYKDFTKGKQSSGALPKILSTLLSDNDKFVPVDSRTMKDGVEYWSDESLLLSESEKIDFTSCSEEDFEEFIEVFVQSRAKDEKSDSTSNSVPEKGFKTELKLLQGKPSFSEIVKYQPKTFVHEIIPKSERSTPEKENRGEEKDAKGMKGTVSEEADALSLVLSGKGSDDRERRGDDSLGSSVSSNIVEQTSNDLIIRIQIEIDDQEEREDISTQNNPIYIDFKVGSEAVRRSSNNFQGKECVYMISKGAIAQLNRENVENDVRNTGTSKRLMRETRSLGDIRKETRERRIPFTQSPIMVDKSTENTLDEGEDEKTDVEEELESKSYHSFYSDENETKITKVKAVTFQDELSELLTETEIQQVLPEAEPPAKIWAKADTIILFQRLSQVEIWNFQQERYQIIHLEPRMPTPSHFLPENKDELQKALNLIQEIENDIIEVKLNEAIKILPLLESELRKHLRDKMKGMAERRKTPAQDGSSVDNFFSTLEFWPREELVDGHKGSEERLQHVLKLLSDLEAAVKSNNPSNEQLCQHSSSRIFNLLNALNVNIRELEEDPSVSNLSETLEITSQLDTAVREFDDSVKKTPDDNVNPSKESLEEIESEESELQSVSEEEPSVKDYLKNVREKVFGMVEEDATQTEERIEMDFDRIDRLERENDESMKFVEAFLEKTLRRSSELTTLKAELKNLSAVLDEMYRELVKANERKSILEQRQKSKRPPSPPSKETPLRNTVSGLLLALDRLKTRAREKNELCKEILGSIASATSYKTINLDRENSRSSKSSFTTKSAEGLVASVKEFKKIGQSSLYLAWSRPEGTLTDSITGYEILVNGKLNQKVRNPQRQQAVLYSVDLSQTAEVQLYGLVENGSKILLAVVTYLDL